MRVVNVSGENEGVGLRWAVGLGGVEEGGEEGLDGRGDGGVVVG